MIDTTPRARTAVIVEDDDELRRLLEEILEAAGFSTVSVDNGIDGIEAVLSTGPLVTTLDVNMPGIDGIEVARRIRSQSDTYIVMITAMGEEADVVLGLTAGADEYITKPFRPREFRARIEAMLRRGHAATGTVPVQSQQSGGASSPVARAGTSVPPSASADDRDAADPIEVVALAVPVDDGQWLVHRNLQLDLDSRLVLIDGEQVDLTRTEFELLAALLESRRRVRSKAELTLVVRSESYATTSYVADADKRVIEAHMTNLRRKLGDSPAQPRFIETVRGVGYRLTSEATTSPV